MKIFNPKFDILQTDVGDECVGMDNDRCFDSDDQDDPAPALDMPFSPLHSKFHPASLSRSASLDQNDDAASTKSF